MRLTVLIISLSLLHVVLAACPAVDRNSLSYDYTQYTTRFTISGSGHFTTAQPACNTLFVTRLGSPNVQIGKGLVDTTTGDFNYVHDGSGNLPDGVNTFSIRIGASDGTSLSSRTDVNIDIQASPCAIPADLTPTNGQTVNNRRPDLVFTAPSPLQPGCEYIRIIPSNGPQAGQEYVNYMYGDTNRYDNFFASSAPPYYLVDGSYTFTIETFGYQNRATAVQTRTFTVANVQSCPMPTVTAPSENGPNVYYQPYYPLLTGTIPASRSDCRQITYSVYGPQPGDQQTSVVYANPPGDGGDLTFSIGLPSSIGSYDIELAAQVDEDVELSELVTRSYEYRSIRCSPPVITYPAEGEYVKDKQPTLRGTQDNPSVCSLISVWLDGYQQDYIPVASDGTWSITYPSETYIGSHYAYAYAHDSNQVQASDSSEYRYYNILDRCPTPYDFYEAVASDRSVSLKGQADYSFEICRTIRLYNNVGQLFASPVYDPNLSGWELTKDNLAPGKYSITAVNGNDEYASLPSNPFEFEVAGSAVSPIPRRRSLCKPTESSCPFKKTRQGKTFYECLPDLMTNIERCGACNGPDCTAMPHVADVACVNGTCKVKACLTGFEQLGDECIRPIGIDLFVQS